MHLSPKLELNTKQTVSLDSSTGAGVLQFGLCGRVSENCSNKAKFWAGPESG